MIEDLTKATPTEIDAEWRQLLNEGSQKYMAPGESERIGRRMAAISRECTRRRKEREKELAR